MLRRCVHAALVVATLVLCAGTAVVRSAEERVLALITLRDQPAVRASRVEGLVASASSAEAHDLADAQRTARAMRRAAPLLAASQSSVLSRLRELGSDVVYTGRAFNAIVASVPVSALERLRKRSDVLSVEVDEPRHALLENATASMLIAPFWTAGVRGGAVDVAVVDCGIFRDHEAFAPRQSSLVSAVFHRAAKTRSDYNDILGDPDDFGSHGTFVAGMVFSQGSAFVPQRLGVAYGLDTLYNLKAAYAQYPSGASSLLSDTMEAVDWALAQADPPEVFNYSYGATAYTDDDSYARFWDAVVDGFGKVATIPAGNGGPSGTTLGSPGIAYNVVSVGNLSTRSTAARTDDTIATTSSRGPTTGGRKKPDLVAPGTSISLPSPFGPKAWEPVTGTSFSSPAIAGAAALLIDAGVTDPRAVKAVMINSADDLGTTGWDASYGWGSFNGDRAWSERNSVVVSTYGSPSATAGRRFFERRTSAATKATLVWNRHVTYDAGEVGTTGVLNDLDLRLFSLATNQQRAASTSSKDNVEQVTSPTSEASVLVVQSTGSFSGTTETAALAHGGDFVERSGPDLSVELSAPGTAAPGTLFTVVAALTNSGDMQGHDYRATIELPAGYSLTSGTSTQGVGALASAARTAVSWQVRAPNLAHAPQAIRVTGTTSSYGWQWTAASTVSVAIGLGCAYSLQGPTELPASGGAAQVQVTTAAGCAWSAASATNWITVSSGASGTGPGVVTLEVATNTSVVPRTGTLSIAGTAVPIQQAAGTVPGARRYYLAEGATGPLFDLSIAIANPNLTAAPVVATFLREDGTTVTRDLQVAAQARVVVHVNAIPQLATGPVSTVIESTSGLPLAVERTMVWDGEGYGGHSGSAVEGPQTRWYFAEGSQGFFDTYVLLANASSTTARATVTFLLEDSAPVTRDVVVAPTTRATLFVGGVTELVGRSFSIVVDADVPIIAERAMYWTNDDTFWTGGHESAGVPAPATRWLHAEGATGPYFDTYLLLANPNAQATQARVTYLLPDGSTVVKLKDLPAQSRTTILVDNEDLRLADTSVSATVDADLPIVSERAMYWPDAHWQEAHNSFGQTETAMRWAVADGCQGGARAYDTYILVANPGMSAASVRVTFLREHGLPVTKQFTVAATSRFNVAVGAEAPELKGECFGVAVESTNGIEVAVERATYWDARGVRWAAGTNATATKLP